MKKGQLIGQPLIYLFALVAGALILTWGVSTVMKMQKTAGQVELGKFASKVESEADKYLNFDEGSKTTISLALPAKIQYLCFYDSSKDKDCKLDGQNCNIASLDEKFAALANTKTKYNMFFLPLGEYGLPPKEIDGLEIDPEAGNPLCFRNKAGNKFTLTSMGTYVSVS